MGVVKFYFWIWKDVLLTLVTVLLLFRLYFGCFCYKTIFGALITLIEFGVQLGAPSCRSRFAVCQVTLSHKLRIRFLASKRVNNIISTCARFATITRFMGPWTMNQSGQAGTKTHVSKCNTWFCLLHTEPVLECVYNRCPKWPPSGRIRNLSRGPRLQKWVGVSTCWSYNRQRVWRGVPSKSTGSLFSKNLL